MSAERRYSSDEAKALAPGAEHYMAYVGPPGQYDLMGAAQFRLLVTLGMRDTSRILDFGCGSLRAGRIFIPYLEPGRYYGVEPNQWLVDDAIRYQLGRDIVALKRPTFAHVSDFCVPFESVEFDFILAQSIFSHTGMDLVLRSLASFSEHLADDGLIAATFAMTKDGRDFTGQGWAYPECVRYREETVLGAFRQSGLHAIRIPFFHPRQRWFLAARSESSLPRSHLLRHLDGAVLNVPEFAGSISPDGDRAGN